jgi:hypothetical protein
MYNSRQLWGHQDDSSKMYRRAVLGKASGQPLPSSPLTKRPRQCEHACGECFAGASPLPWGDTCGWGFCFRIIWRRAFGGALCRGQAEREARALLKSLEDAKLVGQDYQTSALVTLRQTCSDTGVQVGCRC